LLAVQSFYFWHKHPGGEHFVLRGAAGGFLILVLLGFAPETDFIAHLGGFLSGAILGIVLNVFFRKLFQNELANRISLLVLASWVALTWGQAIKAF